MFREHAVLCGIQVWISYFAYFAFFADVFLGRQISTAALASTRSLSVVCNVSDSQSTFIQVSMSGY